MGKLVSVSTFIDRELKDAFEMICREENCSVYAKLAELIEEYVRSKLKQDKKEYKNGEEEDW